MTEGHYSIRIKDSEGKVKNSFMLTNKEVESVGGIGNVAETLSHTLRSEGRVEITKFFS